MHLIKIQNKKDGRIAYIAGNSSENVETRYEKFFKKEWNRLPLD